MLRFTVQHLIARHLNLVNITSRTPVCACIPSIIRISKTPGCRSLHTTSPISSRQLSDEIEEDSDSFGTLDPRFLDSKSITKKESGFGRGENFISPNTEKSSTFNHDTGEEFADYEDEKTFPEFDETEGGDEVEQKCTDTWQEEETEDDDGREADRHIRLSKFDRKHHQAWYDHRLIKMSKRGQVIEAVTMLKEEMIKKDRVLPTPVSYTVVISALAKAGYTKLAFKLFREMRVMGLKAPKHVLSALFNACANCSDKDEGLRRALNLKDYIVRKGFVLHYITYKAGMKAFAMCGDLKNAFGYLDEAIKEGHKLDLEAISMLLMACISDKVNGFNYAVQIWRIMKSKGIVPEITQYNFLARCVKECGIGESRDVTELLQTGPDQKLLSKVRVAKPIKFKRLTLEEKKSLNVKSLSVVNLDGDVPDVLAPVPILENILAVQMVKTAPDRLALLGGVSGILARMRIDNCKPDIKTFTLLIDCIESNEDAETTLVQYMKTFKIKPDTPFCNLLMRKRIFRHDLSSALDVYHTMKFHHITPDLHTYATVALTCKNKSDAFELLKEMEKQEIPATREIFSHLNQAAYMSFNYRQWICERMSELEIDPDELFIRQCERMIKFARRQLLQMDERKEKNGGEESNQDKTFRQKFKHFMLFYKPWLMKNQLFVPKREPRKLDNLIRPVEPVRVEL